MNKRQIQYQETKKKLWETGKKLIAQKGYDQVTIEDITEACGVAKGTFYHYFKSKDTFLFDIERAPYIELEEKMKGMHDTRLADKLDFYISKRFQILSENSMDFTRQWLRHAAMPTYLESYGEESKIDFDIEMISKFITDAMEQGELTPDTPVHTLSHVIILTLFGTTVHHCLSNGTFPLDQWGQELSQFIRDHILKPYLK